MFVQVYKASLRAQDCLRAINWAILTTSWLLLPMRAETAKGLSQINYLHFWSSGNILYTRVNSIQILILLFNCPPSVASASTSTGWVWDSSGSLRHLLVLCRKHYNSRIARLFEPGISPA